MSSSVALATSDMSLLFPFLDFSTTMHTNMVFPLDSCVCVSSI